MYKQIPMFDGGQKSGFKYPDKVLDERTRIRNRNRYRMRHGISIDAPVWSEKGGKPVRNRKLDGRYHLPLHSVQQTLL